MGEEQYTPTGKKYLPNDLIAELGDEIKRYVAGYVSKHLGGGSPDIEIATDEEVSEMLDDVFSSDENA